MVECSAEKRHSAKPAPLYYLLSNTLPPYRLRKNRPCVIGRATTCGYRIDSDFVSRTHAEIRFDGRRWLVRDLGGRNGLSVYGHPVSEQLLDDGARIQVADTELVFRELTEKQARRLIDNPDQALDQLTPVSKPELHGNLDGLAMPELVQHIHHGMRSGRLHIVERDSGKHAELYFEDGCVVHASLDHLDGERAARSTLRIKAGTFRFDPRVHGPGRSVASPTPKLLFDTLDEQ